MVEMTEADYAELERMKRPKRTGVSNVSPGRVFGLGTWVPRWLLI